MAASLILLTLWEPVAQRNLLDDLVDPIDPAAVRARAGTWPASPACPRPGGVRRRHGRRHSRHPRLIRHWRRDRPLVLGHGAVRPLFPESRPAPRRRVCSSASARPGSLETRSMARTDCDRARAVKPLVLNGCPRRGKGNALRGAPCAMREFIVLRKTKGLVGQTEACQTGLVMINGDRRRHGRYGYATSTDREAKRKPMFMLKHLQRRCAGRHAMRAAPQTPTHERENNHFFLLPSPSAQSRAIRAVAL